MKKVILFLMLVLTINTTFAQEVPQQFRRVYSEVVCIKKKNTPTRREAENTVFFNYGNEAVIKIYMDDDSVIYFDQIVETSEGSTQGGMKYKGATYEVRTSETSAEVEPSLTVFVQLFEDRRYGFRLIFENGDMIQFFE
jgi:hypothetical protein